MILKTIDEDGILCDYVTGVHGFKFLKETLELVYSLEDFVVSEMGSSKTAAFLKSKEQKMVVANKKVFIMQDDGVNIDKLDLLGIGVSLNSTKTAFINFESIIVGELKLPSFKYRPFHSLSSLDFEDLDRDLKAVGLDMEDMSPAIIKIIVESQK